MSDEQTCDWCGVDVGRYGQQKSFDILLVTGDDGDYVQLKLCADCKAKSEETA